MDFETVIRSRRSIRSYDPGDIPDSVLSKILEGARVAPSGNNGQPWIFIVIRDNGKKQQIADACYNQSFIADAPVVIVCCAKNYINSCEPHKEKSALIDTIISIDHLILTARNEGIASCWVGAVHTEPIKEILNIPKDIDVVMVVPLGYPAKASFHETTSRKSLREITFSEEYGKPYQS